MVALFIDSVYRNCATRHDASPHFQDIVQRRTGGVSPFGNIGARYSGSDNDVALNAAVLRYPADPDAVQRFGADTDLAGRIAIPVLTVHGVDDPTAFVEMESAFRQTMTQGGSAANLVQTFADFSEHSYLSDPTYPALVDSLLGGATKGAKPSAASVAARCREVEDRFGPGCRFLPDFQPMALETRVVPRQRP